MDASKSDSAPILRFVGKRPEGRNMLAPLLRHRRRELRITQEELAARLGVRPQTVSAWERGSAPQTRFHGAVAAFLELPGGPSELVALVEGGSVPKSDVGPSGADLRQAVVKTIATLLQEGTPDDKRTALYHDLLKAVMESPI